MRIHYTGVILAAMAGCASTPNVEVTYFLPKATLHTSVVRTIGCDVQDNVTIVTTVLSKPVYTRDDRKERRYTIPINAADGFWSNSETTVNLLEDGRLSGFNASQTGQGTEMMKSAAVLAGAVLAAASGDPDLVTKECDYVRKAGKDKGLTLTFIDEEKFDSAGVVAQHKLEPHPDSADHFKEVKNILGDVCLEATPQSEIIPRTNWVSDGKRNAFEIVAVEPAVYDIAVKQSGDTFCSTQVWSGTVLVPQHGAPLRLPVRKAALFGKQTAAFGFAESGAPTMIKYGKDSGAAGSLGAANELFGLLTTTNAEAVAALKAEADIIAQHQRVIRCKTDPTTCI